MAKILVIEEDNSLRKLLEDQLKLLGHEIVTAKDAFQVLEIMSEPDIEKNLDLIISEIDIKPVNGVSLMKMIKRIYGDIPFLFATHLDGRKKEALEAGASGFIKKVFELREFRDAVQEVLEKTKNEPKSPA